MIYLSLIFLALLLGGSIEKNIIATTQIAHNRPPVYPLESRENGEEGIVVLKVLVKNDGSADRVLIKQSSGYERLDQSAVQAVKQWLFSPASANGNPLEEWVEVPIRFVLPGLKKKNLWALLFLIGR